MKLRIFAPNMANRTEWERKVERHCDLTLRALAPPLTRVDVRLQQTNGREKNSSFVCELAVYATGQHSIEVRSEHSDAQVSIAMAFARAKRGLLRKLDRGRLLR